MMEMYDHALADILHCGFSSSIENFDDGPVQSFILDRNVIEVRDHFFEYRGEVYWAVMVIYSDAEANCGGGKSQGRP